MTYEVVMPYHLHMPSYFLGTFTEYPYLEKPVLGICQPCHYPYPENIGPGYNPHHSGSNKQYFSVYSVFHVSVLYNPADTGNKDSENMFVNSYCVPCWRSVVCMYQ